MNRKLLVFLLTLMICTCVISFTAMAAITSPTTIGAPEHFAAGHYQRDYFYYTFSAPDDLRTIIDSSDPTIKAQLDYKLGNGDWHYVSTWDTAKYSLKNTLGVSYARGKWYITGGRESLSSMFPEDAAVLKPIIDSGWNIPPQPLSFRVRFVASFDGNKTYVYSDWSDTYVYSKDVKSDPDKLINHAPTLTSAIVEKNSGGMPFLNVKTGRLPGEVQDLNAMTSGAVWTEIWLRKAGDKDFKIINSSFFSNEYILIAVSDYFSKALQSYDTESYEIKIRYKIDLRSYPQVGRSDIIYSPFSNVYSQNMPAWSGASTWATGDLKKADEYGLIPDILRGADLTKPITREEFCELALLLYEKTTGKSPAPASPNPFTDTQNPKILKAYQLRITSGTSTTTFSPEKLIPREQVAAMLCNAIKAMVPDSDFSTAGAPVFSDQRDISPWALESVKYITKMGIIRGADGKFMPRATTTAQEAAGYGRTTREAAILMSLRTYDSLSAAAAPTQTAPASGMVTGRNSSDDYERIKVMGTLDEVIGILGHGMKVSSETEDFYIWGNVGNGAYIEISFVDGHVKSIGCVGNYQADKCEKIKLDMSFNEVISILGEGKKSKTEVNDYYEWKYSGGETIEIMVKGNIVIGKSKF